MSTGKSKSSDDDWKRVGECLFRYVPSGVYYAKFKHAGKQYKKSLKTKDKAHAKRELKAYRQDIENITSKESVRVTFETIADRWITSVRADGRKESTIHRRQTCIKALKPHFRKVTLSGITAEMCDRWKVGRAPEIAPQSLAHEIGTLKGILEFAVQQGILYRNPARALKRPRIIRVCEKSIPTREQFTKLVATIRKSDGRPESQAAAKHGADFVELLAYSGMRKGEAAALKWQDVDFAKNQLMVTGGANRTKNYETRSVPISAELRELLLRLRAGSQAAPTDNVARIADPKKCLHTACRKLKLPYFSPHRFRDFFATTCIEHGTDIPTVARWLGHKDGGALLMKTYAHLRQEHSQEAMKKITFGANLRQI